jgi:hypothetical protein
MAMLTTPTQIPFYSPTRNAMYVIVKPAPRNPCYTDEHASAAAPEGLLSPADLGFCARDSLDLVRVQRMERKERRSVRSYLKKLLRGIRGC